MSDRVVVLGGGLAGITAALDCAVAGAQVTLLEVRRRLGGAAYSVQRDGLEMDNGQHVFLRGCLAYRGLLERLGSSHLVSVQPRLEIPVLSPSGGGAGEAGRYVLRRDPLPAPLQLARALARYPHLSLRERFGAARAALALARIDERELRRDAVTLGQWLARHGQTPSAVAALWDLIALPTLNLPAEEASLELGAFVFRRGLLSSAEAGDIGFHVGTLGQIIAAPAAAALDAAGVEVRLGWRGEAIARSGSSLQLLGRGGRAAAAGDEEEDEGEGARPAAPAGEREALDADALIVAIPHSRAAGLLEPLLGPRATRLRRLGSSPIVNLHVVYDRAVCDVPFAAGVGTPVQYLFDRSRAAGAPAGCQYLAVSLSGAEREMKESVEDLSARYLPALRELLPAARGAKVESFLVTREHAATFRAAPGVGALRPGPRTEVAGLLLAGTWTDTGWPATLESAVLSGHAAASAALESIGAPGYAPAGGVPRGSAPAEAHATPAAEVAEAPQTAQARARAPGAGA
jgi:squalene-associated FAD-dependent desaturase